MISSAWSSLAHHTVHYKSPICSEISQANYILLAEDHLSIRIREMNARLIDSLITPNSVLLCEGILTMRPIEGSVRVGFMEDYHIKEASQKNLTCYGWDAINHRAGEEDLSGVCRFVCKPEPNGSSTITVDDNWEERFPKKLSSEVALSLKIAAAQELWRRESSEEVMNMPPLKRRKLESDNECLINECFEDIANSVQPRTQALIETLRKIENLRTQGKITGKIFLIAGTYHLVEHFHDPRLSLQPLYKELEKLPSVVLVRK